MWVMSGAFPVLIGIALAAVLLTLVVGVLAMLKGGEFNARHGNRLMRLRVGVQFAALVLIGLAFLLRDG
jgi:hypothetical protein